MLNTLSEIKLENNGEMSIVRVLDSGKVEIERDGATTVFGSAITRAIEEKAATQNIPAAVQSDVDQYIQLHELKSQIEKLMKPLQDNVRTYMDNNNMKAVISTSGKKIELVDAKASNSTSLYNDYEVDPIKAILDAKLFRKVTETRINSQKLEALLKVENVYNKNEILALKIAKMGTPRFTVKK